VFDVAAPAAPIISCFTSVNSTAQGLPAVQALQYNSTVTTWLPANTSSMGNGTYFNATTNTTHYYSVNGTYGWNGTWNATGNSTWNGSAVITEPFVCASYKLELCAPGSSECEGYEDTPGVSSWAYYPLTLSQCFQMHWMSQQVGSHFKGVACCSTDNCNAPDPTLDGKTQIVGPASDIISSQQCKLGVHIRSSNVLCAAVNWSLSVWEATPFPGTRTAFVKVAADLDPTWEQQQHQLGQRYMAWQHAVLPLQPAMHEPPAAYGIPVPFTVRALGDGHCEVSAVPVSLFGGTAEFFVHVEHAANGDAWLEVWGRAHDDMDGAAAAAMFGSVGWSRNTVTFINMLGRKK
jgi:hypothetical protein